MLSLYKTPGRALGCQATWSMYDAGMCAGAADSTKGPDEEAKRMGESDVQFAGDKPDPKDIPHTRHQSR